MKFALYISGRKITNAAYFSNLVEQGHDVCNAEARFQDTLQ
jgi:hypothetical protein